ncbi:MAG: beta strand repeat-containing protein [Hyphomicrobium sp.]
MAKITGTNGKNKLKGTSSADTILGLGGADSLLGLGGNDSLDGGLGNDILDGGKGRDKMSGGKGNDTYLVDAAGDKTIEKSGGGNDTVKSRVNWTLAGNVENLTLIAAAISGSGNALTNKIIGTAAGNTLNGLGGNDNIDGGGGNDTIDGGTGADAMFGGAGNDTFVVDNAGDTVSGGSGADTVRSSVSFTLAADTENLVLIGANAINGTGNAAVNVITGNDAANTLDGGAGADAMDGGGGDDTFIVDDAGDTATGGSGIDLVRSSVSFTLAADVENLVLLGANAINGTGNALGNTITGNDAANTLSGLDGTDTLIGGDGDDTLQGGAGADALFGGLGTDTASYAANTTGVTIIFAAPANSTGDAFGDTFDSIEIFVGGSGGDIFAGGSANVVRRFFGLSGDDQLSGGGADDILYGGDGNDQLAGGDGADGNDQLFGEAGNDDLHGVDGNDQLFGGEGDDQLRGYTGDDAMDGGNGSDTYWFENQTHIQAADVIADSGTSGTDVITFLSFTTGSFDFQAMGSVASIEQLTFTNSQTAAFRAAQLPGTFSVDAASGETNSFLVTQASSFDGSNWVISNWDANDTFQISGTSGANTLTGTSVPDFIFAGDGADTLRGGAGADYLSGDEHGDRYLFGTNDVDSGEAVFDNGTIGTDTLVLDNTVTTLSFGDAAITGIEALEFDALTANQRAIFTGGQFNPTGISTSFNIIAAQAGSRVSVVDATTFSAAAFTFSGAAAAGITLSITGTSANNTITGSAHFDTLFGRQGADTLDGGQSDDVYLYTTDLNEAASGESITDTGGSLGDEIAVASGTSQTDFSGATISGIERFSFTEGAGAIFNASQLSALASNLLWIGSPNYDITITINNASAFTAAAWTFSAWSSTDTFVINGTANVDNIIGTSQDDEIATGAMGDSLFAGAGDDILIGGAGADNQRGENGNDIYRFGVGEFAASEEVWDTGVTVGNIDTLQVVGDGTYVPITGAFTFAGIEALQYTATATSQNIEMFSSQTAGISSVTGAAGQQFLTIYLDNVLNSNFDGSAIAVTNWTAGTDVLNIQGTGGNNTITGTGAADLISGLGGTDTIRGFGGADTLSGDTSAVSFYFDIGETGVGAGNRDQILFYTQGNDSIDLTAIAPAYIGTGAFTGLNAPEVRHQLTNGNTDTLVEIDSDGSGTADMQIIIAGFTNALTIADFSL